MPGILLVDHRVVVKLTVRFRANNQHILCLLGRAYRIKGAIICLLQLLSTLNLSIFNILNHRLRSLIIFFFRAWTALWRILLLAKQMSVLIRGRQHLILVKVVRHMHCLLPLSISSFRLIQLIFNIDLLDLLANRLVTLVWLFHISGLILPLEGVDLIRRVFIQSRLPKDSLTNTWFSQSPLATGTLVESRGCTNGGLTELHFVNLRGGKRVLHLLLTKRIVSG